MRHHVHTHLSSCSSLLRFATFYHQTLHLPTDQLTSSLCSLISFILPQLQCRQTGGQSSRAEWDRCTTVASCQAAQQGMKLRNESRDPPAPRDLTSWKPTAFSAVQRNVRYITLSLQSLSWRLGLKLTQCVNRGNTSAATSELIKGHKSTQTRMRPSILRYLKRTIQYYTSTTHDKILTNLS